MNNYFIKIEKFIINKYINLFPLELKDKVLYLIQNGKRLRPILFLIFTGENELDYDINDACINYNSKINIIYIIAIIIELLHSLSLVLDDLPVMDNDNIRRHNLSFHCKYGIEYTNFFIYYIFNHIALELDNCNNFLFQNNNKKINKKTIELNIKIVNDIQCIIKTNLNYLIDGQYDDLEWNINDITSSSSNIKKKNSIIFINEKKIILDLLNKNSTENIDDIEINIELNIKKTSSLFNLSITTGYILQLWKHNIYYLNNEKYNKIYNLLSIFSNILGYIFQISDDILDSESDKIKNKPNICSIIDKDIVINLLKNGCKWLCENAKTIHILMNSIENNIHTDDLENPTCKYYESEYNNYSGNSDDSDDNSDDDDSNNNMKNITFNLTVINEIIEKIEKRVKKDNT